MISDTHFAHENIYKFTSFDGITRVRPRFKNAEEADRMMIELWNAHVLPEDHVYHLGDVALGPGGLWKVKELQGHKRLILGNHDPYNPAGIRALLEVGFQKIYSTHRIDDFLLSHVPVHPFTLERGLINVHGHIHERPPYNDSYRNVSVERINYTPILLNSLKRP